MRLLKKLHINSIFCRCSEVVSITFCVDMAKGLGLERSLPCCLPINMSRSQCLCLCLAICQIHIIFVHHAVVCTACPKWFNSPSLVSIKVISPTVIARFSKIVFVARGVKMAPISSTSPVCRLPKDVCSPRSFSICLTGC